MTYTGSCLSCSGRRFSLRNWPRLLSQGGDHVFASWANRQAISGLVIRAKRQTGPHRRRFRIVVATAVCVATAGIGNRFHPIRKASHKLAVVVGVAGVKVEVSLGRNRTDRASCHAQFAFQARVEVDRDRLLLLVVSRLGFFFWFGCFFVFYFFAFWFFDY